MAKAIRSVGRHTKEAHKDAFVIWFLYDGVGLGTKESVFRLMKMKYGIKGRRTIDDWANQTNCPDKCGWHDWDKLKQRIQQGDFPMPTKADLEEAMLGAISEEQEETLNLAKKVDDLSAGIVRILGRKITFIEQANSDDEFFKRTKAWTSVDNQLYRDLKEWLQQRNVALPKDIEGTVEHDALDNEEEEEAVAIGGDVPPVIQMEEADEV